MDLRDIYSRCVPLKKITYTLRNNYNTFVKIWQLYQSVIRLVELNAKVFRTYKPTVISVKYCPYAVFLLSSSVWVGLEMCFVHASLTWTFCKKKKKKKAQPLIEDTARQYVCAGLIPVVSVFRKTLIYPGRSHYSHTKTSCESFMQWKLSLVP